MKNKKRLQADIILIVSLLLISAIALTVILVTRKSGKYAVVTVNGQEVGKYSLSRDGEYAVGDGSNVIAIENGRVFMKYACCPDKTCQKRGKVYRSGESITCLPNRVNVQIIGNTSDGVELVS